jgi:hypothetical protein
MQLRSGWSIHVAAGLAPASPEIKKYPLTLISPARGERKSVRKTGETLVLPGIMDCLCEWLNSFTSEANEAITLYRKSESMPESEVAALVHPSTEGFSMLAMTTVKFA